MGLVVCMAVIFLRSKGTQKIKMLVTLTVVGSLLVVVLSQVAPEGFFDEYVARMKTVVGEENVESGDTVREGSSAGRVAMWKGAIEVYKNHSEYWLLGVGMNCYARMYARHFDEIAEVLTGRELAMVWGRGRGGKELHNTYLSVLMGGGAVVFLTWMFLILYSWFQIRTVPRKYPQIVDGVDIHNYARAIEVGIIGYCVSMIFINMEFVDLFYWHLTMSAIVTNLGKAQLQKEALGLEDEEFTEQPARRPAYIH